MADAAELPKIILRMPTGDAALRAGFDLTMAETCGRLAALFAEPRLAADPLACALAVEVLAAEDLEDLEAAVDRLGERVSDLAACSRPQPAAAVQSEHGARLRFRL